MRSRLLMLGLAACGHGTPSPTTPSDAELQPPCADGSWAGWDSPDGVVWVAPDGDDSADGSAGHPLLTLAAAMQTTRTLNPARIGLMPGTWHEEVQLKGPAISARHTPPPEDAGGRSLTLSGCSSQETILAGTSFPPAPVVALIGPGDTTLRRLSTQGGASGVVIVHGATAVVEDVAIQNGRGRGVSVVGADTWASLRRVSISDTQDLMGFRPAGWGLATREATVELEDVTISSNTSFGLFLDRGTVSAHQLVVQHTTSNGKDRQGVGVYAEHLDSLRISDCHVEDSAGTGIFAVDTHRLHISGCLVDGVTASLTAPGDGIVIRRVGQSAEAQQASLVGNTVEDAQRLGVAVSGDILLYLDDNLAGSSNGVLSDEHSIFADAAVSVSGPQAATPLDTGTYPLGRLFVGEDGPAHTHAYP